VPRRACGSLSLNITNPHLDLAVVRGNLAQALGLAGAHCIDREVTPQDRVDQRNASHWALLARDRAVLEAGAADDCWEPFSRDPRLGLWTDDFSNVLGAALLAPPRAASPR
jgi:hypothetical protein